MNDKEDLMSDQMTPAPDFAEFTDELTDESLDRASGIAHCMCCNACTGSHIGLIPQS
jgi:heterodisulfide reductase subunit C